MGENTRKDRRTKVLSMTVRYRSATLGEFIEHHSYDVSRGGMFIKTPSPFPPGTLLKFEVKIADEQRVMQGVGRVVWKRDRDGVGSDEPAGMGIKFIKIDEASRAVIDRLVGERGADEAGAFEKPPASIPHMFPAGALAPPEPHDRTVMKSADQLLQDALEKTGETAESSASFDLVRERVSSFPPARKGSDVDTSGGTERGNGVAAQNERDSTEHGPGQKPADNSPSGRRETSAAAPRAATSFPPDGAEGGGGRAVLAILAAVIVAGGIYIAVKRTPGDQSARPAASGAVAPSVVAPPVLAPAPIDPPPQPSAPRDPTSLGHGTAAATADAAPMPRPKPVIPVRPRPHPQPVPKPAPPPAPVPKPAPPPTPVPRPRPLPTPAPAAAKDSAPPAESAQPAPTPPAAPSPSEEPEDDPPPTQPPGVAPTSP